MAGDGGGLDSGRSSGGTRKLHECECSRPEGALRLYGLVDQYSYVRLNRSSAQNRNAVEFPLRPVIEQRREPAPLLGAFPTADAVDVFPAR